MSPVSPMRGLKKNYMKRGQIYRVHAVLEVMKKEGMPKELLDPLVEVAIKATGPVSNIKEKRRRRSTQ